MNENQNSLLKLTGRPTIYTEELAETICNRIAEGETLERIARDEGMPCRRTVWEWSKARPEFNHMLQRARELMAVSFVDEALEIADATMGKGYEEIQAAKLRIDTRKWIATKYGRAVFGDVVRKEMTGQDGGPIEIKRPSDLSKLTDEQLNQLEELVRMIEG